jgi:hypothetical protein
MLVDLLQHEHRAGFREETVFPHHLAQPKRSKERIVMMVGTSRSATFYFRGYLGVSCQS